MQYHSSQSPKNLKLQFRGLVGDRGSLGELGALRGQVNTFQSPRSLRNRPNRKHKLRQELLLPVLEPRLKLPSLPPLLKEKLGKCGRMSSALRIPTTHRNEEDEDSIVIYKELRQGQALVFCPPGVRFSAA